MRSVAEVAHDMGVTVERVRQLIGAGALPAERVGGRWVLPDNAGHTAELRPSGRPWSEGAAWGLLWVGIGRPAPWLSLKQHQRVSHRWRLGAEKQVDRLRRRADLISYSAHPAAVRRIIDDLRIVRSGVSALTEFGVDLVVSDVAEGYVRFVDCQALITEYGLERNEAKSGNLVLHTITTLWPFDDGEHIAPALVVALDLLESSDPRTQRAGRALWSKELKRLRR
jgi:hypothetical protein